MQSILDVDPDFASLSLGNEILKKWHKCLVSFHSGKPHSPNTVLTVGSGCIASIGDRLTIVTAFHVVSDFVESRQGFGAIVNGHHIALDGTKFLGSEREDCAFMDIPASLPVNTLPSIVSGRRPEMLATSSFIIFGYPETRNRFDSRKPGQGLHVHSVISHSFQSDPIAGTLIFPYDPKYVYTEATSAAKSAPHLKGMSGSPVAQLLFNPVSGSLGLRLVGVFIRWSKNQKNLVAHCFPDFGRELHEDWDSFGTRTR